MPAEYQLLVNIETYATDHLNPVLYFVLIFAVPFARLFLVLVQCSVCL